MAEGFTIKARKVANGYVVHVTQARGNDSFHQEYISLPSTIKELVVRLASDEVEHLYALSQEKG